VSRYFHFTLLHMMVLSFESLEETLELSVTILIKAIKLHFVFCGAVHF